MEGYEIIVELKTGKRHRGRLTSADDNMNLTLEEEPEQEQKQKQEQVSEQQQQQQQPNSSSSSSNTTTVTLIVVERNIRGSNVRYIHFPDNANLSTLIQSGRERERNASRKYQKTKRKSS